MTNFSSRSRALGSSLGGLRGERGPQGARGLQGPPGSFPFAQPAAPGDEHSIPVTRVDGGKVDFDYLQSDDIEFGDRGVPIGRHLTAADGNLPAAMIAAKAANPSKRKFLLPPGEYAMSQVTEASGALGNNMILDGQDRDRCILYRDATGQMLLWQDAPINQVIQNVTFDFRNISGAFSASLNAIDATNFLIQDCAFLCSIPNDVTGDGIRHQINLSGTNIVARRNYFYRSQLRLSTLGSSTQHASAFDNDFEDCNDLGVSCVGGDSSGDFIRNIRIGRNKFYGTLVGSGYIYVGSDGASVNPEFMSDVDIFDNECTGAIGQLGTDASRPSGRLGIYVVLCEDNKRIKIRGNTIANSNPSYSTPIVFGIGVFLRNGSSSGSEDIEIFDNRLDFRSDDTRAGILIDGPSMTAVKIVQNTIAAGSRGLYVAGCSDSDILYNTVRGSTSTALQLDSARNAMSDVRIRGNKLDAQGSFASAITFAGTHNMTRIVGEHNRLVSATGSAAVSALSGGATLDYAHNYNSQSAGLSGTVTPSQNVGNRTE